MSFDCSRFTFNAWNDFLGVVMQQGRVQLDADWNEWVAQMIRRIQTGTLDTFDRTVVPRGTPDGFRIELGKGQLTIGMGRIYVDGILVENHGGGKLQWDPQRAEQIGSEAIDYLHQPYYPAPPPLPTPDDENWHKRCLVYLDVWQREVTYLQYPDLVEKAVGVDTTARLQTVWQVKLLEVTEQTECSTPDADVFGWAEVIRPSAARLTTTTGDVNGVSEDPCLIPPTGGYTGLENQLYRVEIHNGGATETASFKWSRDNGTVHSLVSQINPAGDRLVVDSVGRDEQLRFSNGDWVEMTNDILELGGKPGIMRQIKSVDDATRTITLTQPLLPGDLPTGVQNNTDTVPPDFHTRIRRWDQSGQIKRADGTVFYDLNDGSGKGVIPIPPAGTTLLLEKGILVKFDLEGSGGSFHAGDHWPFTARAADARIEELNFAPPLGTHHHYARLAVVNFPFGPTSDCRVFWPPEPVAGTDCVCDICVTEDGHAAGTATIQQAIDRLGQAGGIICLAAGTYRLQKPLHIQAHSLIIRGKGERTVLVPAKTGLAIRIQDSLNITLEEFAVIGPAGKGENEGLIMARNTVGLKLDRLQLLAITPGDKSTVAVKFNGYVLDASVQRCAIVADIGITGGRSKEELLFTANLSFSDNLLVCGSVGLRLDKRSLHYGATEFTRNLVLTASLAAVIALGGVLPSSSFRIEANGLYVAGDGIIAGTDGLRITDNEIGGSTNRKSGNGIILAPGLDPTGIDHVWLMGNRLTELSGTGIEVRAPLGSAMIKHNIIERTRGGIVFVQAGASTHLIIDHNQLLSIAKGYNPITSVVGIQVLAARNVDIVGNVLSNFAEDALQASDCVAIRVAASGDVRVSGNHLSEIGPKGGLAGYVAGIEIQQPYARTTLSENILSRSAVLDLAALQWQAIRILPQPIRPRPYFSAVGTILIFAPEEIYFLTRTRLRTLEQTLPESLLIRANHGTARLTTTELVTAKGLASCIFSDNYFESIAAARSLGLVELAASTVIASSNRLRWIGGKNGHALNISSKTFTVVGNITTGPIFIGGSQLADPWKPLNVLES